jgi:hypothetical protein
MVDIAELAAMLNAQIESLVAELLPAGERDGQEWRVGSVAGEKGRSMAVRIAGSKSGIWCDYGAGDDMRGDALDLVAQVKFGGDKGKAVAWSRAWLGLDAGDPKRFAEERREASEITKRRSEEVLREQERKSAAAMRIFLEAKVHLRNTPAADYLRGRGIDLAELERQPRSLRFHPSLWNEESGRSWPALVAGIDPPSGPVCAVHRTWLEALSDGRVRKAPLAVPKKVLGRYAGCAIRLWRGYTEKSLSRAEPGEWLLLSEGIEDGLSGAIARPKFRTWAAISVSNMGNIELPAAFDGVIILAQNDTEPRAIAALEAAIGSFHRQGKRVRLIRVPPEVHDSNELLLSGHSLEPALNP